MCIALISNSLLNTSLLYVTILGQMPSKWSELVSFPDGRHHRQLWRQPRMGGPERNPRFGVGTTTWRWTLVSWSLAKGWSCQTSGNSLLFEFLQSLALFRSLFSYIFLTIELYLIFLHAICNLYTKINI